MKRSRKSAVTAPAENMDQPAPGETDGSRAAPGQPAVADAADRLMREIRKHREVLARKVAELRALKGDTGGESDVVRRVVELLSRTEGATMDALLNRILPEKGYTITATTHSLSLRRSSRSAVLGWKYRIGFVAERNVKRPLHIDPKDAVKTCAVEVYESGRLRCGEARAVVHSANMVVVTLAIR
jgi:hypothetical protein